MGKKIGIVTLDGYYNYGNRLQNYALQEVIKKLGFDVNTLVVPRKSNHPEYKRESVNNKLIRMFRQTPSITVERISHRFNFYINKQEIKERTGIFKRFSREYLAERFFDIRKETLESIGRDYDYLITGSDQVWNPYNITYAESAFFLGFVDPEKRISYAASFGITKLPDYFREMIKPWLCEMKAISVRENSGAQIVKDLTGRNAVVSLDPTLLVSKQRWLSIAKESKKPKQRYILTYFLGEKPKEAVLLIKNILRNNNFQIVELVNLKYKEAYKSGPLEFIDYINSAELVLTDSFHGTAFSILMETPFLVFERTRGLTMYSRIDTLLQKLALKHREVSSVKRVKNVFEMDFKHAKLILRDEQERAKDYLKVALNIDKR